MIDTASSERHGYTLASWMERFTAHALDSVLGAVIVIAGLSVGFVLPGPLIILLGVGLLAYVVWFLMTLASGQTPGKRIMNLRVMKTNGEPVTWGYMFLREFLVKGVLVNAASAITAGIFFLVNYLFPLWDKDRQTLHDKMLETLVVKK